jgi:hypothetical protein
MAKTPTGTYVYCLIASARRPALARMPAGLPGMGRARLLETEAPGAIKAPRRGLRKWLAVADAPLSRYGEETINSRLSDLDWVSRAAVAHEAVVEAFIDATAVLPMKLFTIFTNDERALEHLRGEQARINAVLKRVAHHREWGVRVVLDRARATVGQRAVANAAARGQSGIGYLARKKAQRDEAAELAGRASDTVAQLYDLLAGQASLSKRRAPGELPVTGGPLLLDAAFLVPATRSVRFRSLAAREASALDREGYRVTLSGPWPAYSFVQD